MRRGTESKVLSLFYNGIAVGKPASRFDQKLILSIQIFEIIVMADTKSFRGKVKRVVCVDYLHKQGSGVIFLVAKNKVKVFEG